MNIPVSQIVSGYINIYLHDTGRIHCGTGFYNSKEEADRVAKNKKRRIACTFIHGFIVDGRFKAINGGYKKI